MERDFYTDEFEDLIKQKADQFRMYPSDKVWKGVKKALHPNKRRYWLGFALLLTGIAYYSIDQLIISSSDSNTSIKKETKPNASSGEQKVAKVVPCTQDIPGPVFNGRKSDNLLSQKLQQDPKVIVADAGPEEFMTAENPGLAIRKISGDENPVTDAYSKILVPSIQKDNYLSFEPSANVPAPVLVTQVSPEQDAQKEEDTKRVNWLQEFAVYDLATPKVKRLHWQLAFAPTMNYRRLTGSSNSNIPSNVKNVPIALNISGDIDKYVNHKPALGFELGSFLLYSANHSLTLKGGLQFNYSRYEIQAYSSPTEIVTIAVSSLNGLSRDSISTFTRIRNFGGSAVKDIQNQYFQVSVPLGIELRLLGNERLQLGVAGTIQPTYLLNRNTYLITNDYKNYTKEPSLVRRWNLNTSAEAFVSYKTGGLKWQVGPQFRYHLFSNYSPTYPIKEYLMEYGVKIGVTKTIR